MGARVKFEINCFFCLYFLQMYYIECLAGHNCWRWLAATIFRLFCCLVNDSLLLWLCSNYKNKRRLTAMISMPATKPYAARCGWSYSLEAGSSSSSDIRTMIPATKVNIRPNTISFRNGRSMVNRECKINCVNGHGFINSL